MNSALFICSLVLFVIVCNAAAPKVRYINSIPQFGSAAFSAALPHTTLYPSISPGSVSSYSSLSSGSWNFYSSFSRKVSAGSDQYDTENNNWYTIYTAQTTQKKLKNFLLEDSTPLTSGSNAAVRVVNLLQFKFAINASAASSSHSANWANVPYASATTYTNVPPGSYQFDWSSSSLSKRSIEQGGSNCTFNCGGPWWFGFRRTYTIYVLPTITIVVSDGTTSSKREVRSKRAIQKSNALSERLSDTKESNEAPEEVANDEAEVNESIEEGDQSN